MIYALLGALQPLLTCQNLSVHNKEPALKKTQTRKNGKKLVREGIQPLSQSCHLVMPHQLWTGTHDERRCFVGTAREQSMLNSLVYQAVLLVPQTGTH